MEDHIESQHTFLSLVKHTHYAVEKAGSVIIRFQEGDREKLDMYITKLAKLEAALRTKAMQVRNEDKADDLRIMENKIRMLREFMQTLRGTEYRSMASDRGTTSERTMSSRGSPLSSGRSRFGSGYTGAGVSRFA
jgi:hypothetical protein